MICARYTDEIHYVQYHPKEELSVERPQGNLGPEKPSDGGFLPLLTAEG